MKSRVYQLHRRKPAHLVSQTTSAIFYYLANLSDKLMMSHRVGALLFSYIKGPPGPAPDYQEIQHAVSSLTEFRAFLTFRSDKGNDYILPMKFMWGDVPLSVAFPGKPKVPDTGLFEHVSVYTVPVLHVFEATNVPVLRFDSYPHHPHLHTHPHHLHRTNNPKAHAFSGNINDLVAEIEKAI